MTLQDIENVPREYLIPKEVASVLDMDQYTINVAARDAPEKLGFPVVVTGSRVRIPKEAFIYFMKYGRPQAEPPAKWVERCRQAVLEAIRKEAGPT